MLLKRGYNHIAWHCMESENMGYSGIGVASKVPWERYHKGWLPAVGAQDTEARVLNVFFEKYILVHVYAPVTDTDAAGIRNQKRVLWNAHMQTHLRALRQEDETKRPVVLWRPERHHESCRCEPRDGCDRRHSRQSVGTRRHEINLCGARPRGCDFSVSAASSRTPEIHVVQILEQQARDADFPFEDLEEAQLMSALGSLTLEDHSCMTDEEIPPRRRLQANKQQISLYFPGRLKRAL